ncbi:unnamed protein product [Kluyveromyces dobzhanskii CBS 2104]|uniref:WGS project CCBQ000000000 data, contig 00102 n=1 Tax=Kluyveromyces dobzhanskii CBS 2104 TaxID=1427455 RepID=A0A0A8L6X8_9SACH|nr:unnamed protein product [Kluyveromyces dobzhanskii CBS 2104]
MILQQRQRVTKQVLLDLRKGLIGDQSAKFTFYKEHRDLFDAIINYKHYLSLKLDVLLILSHLDKDSCRELGRHGTEVFVRILEMQIPNDSRIEDIAKYVKLRRICVENCTEAETNEQFFFQEFYYVEPLSFFKLAAERLIMTEESIYREIVLEYMTYLSTLPFVMTSQDLILILRDVLNSYVNKYVPAVNFKYAVVTTAKESYGMECDVFYDPNNTTAELMSKGESSSVVDERTQSYESLPQSLEITDVFDIQLIFIISNLLTVLQSNGGCQFSFLSDLKVNVFYASLVRHPDIKLKTSALSFFYCQLGDSWYAENRSDFNSNVDSNLPFPIKLWLPTLISTLNEPELPQFFSPLAILCSLATEYTIAHKPDNVVIDTFFDSNLLNGMIDTFLRLLSLEKQDTDKLQLLSDYLKFFSEIVGKDERCRLLFLENNAVLQYLENAFSSHLLILNNFREDWGQLRKMAPLPPLFDSELVTNWAKCLKACSRSVGVLRTSLKRNKLADYTLQLAREIYEIVSMTYDEGISHLLCQELVLLGELLGAMSNFVVEFSSLRTLMKNNGIISLIKHIFANPVFNTEYIDRAVTPEFSKGNAIVNFHNEASVYSQIMIIQTNSLWVLRHLIYNSETCDKLELLSEIDLESILRFVHSTEPNVLNQCFQLLRNLTCNSRKVINMILDRFNRMDIFTNANEGAIGTITTETNTRETSRAEGNQFLRFLASKLKTVLHDDNYYTDNKIAEALLYIVVNFTAINENKRNLVVAQHELLEIVKEYILMSKGDEITKACLWIITNLIWDSSVQHAPYNNSLPENGSPRFEADWALHQGSSSTVEDRNNDAISRMPLPSRGPNLSEEERTDEADDDPEDDEQSNDEEDVPLDPQKVFQGANSPAANISVSSPALIRFKKLDKLGFDDAVKKILDWNGDLDVKERAKTLLYQMETFRKSTIPP